MADPVAVQPYDPNETLRKLTQNISEYKAPSNWAFDPTYENVANTLNRNIANLTASNTQQVQRLGEDYSTNVGRAGEQNERNLSALQNKLANQGIGYSGINVAEQGRLGQSYQQTLDDLLKGKTRSEEDIAFNTTRQASDWQGLLGQAQVERAGRETEREKEAAAQEAQATAAKKTADDQRQFLSDLQARLTTQVQPQPQPTGQMVTPQVSPHVAVQQAVAAIPAPTSTTPQQQVKNLNIDPKVLQTLLRNRGFDPGPIDGIFGQKSQLALARYKQSIGLPATADIDLNIWSGLYQGMSSQQTFDLLGI